MAFACRFQNGTNITITGDGSNTNPYIVSTSAVTGETVRKNSGADVGTRPRLNFIEGSGVTLTVLDDGVDNEIDITIAVSGGSGSAHVIKDEGIPLIQRSGLNFVGDSVSATDDAGNDETDITINHLSSAVHSVAQPITVRKNTGADVGTRSRLNFIEGTNITLTVLDDGVDNEIDVTIAASGGSSAGSLLAVTSYNPVSIATYTSTVTTSADVDATNLSVTFTVPASGKVLVRLTTLGNSGATDKQLNWDVREGSSVVGPQQQITGLGANNARFSGVFLITGLTPSASKTYKWGFERSGAAGTVTMFAGGVAGEAVMEVFAA